MKRCPACGTTYTDESLKYCLSDGAELIGAAADAATDETISMAAGRPVRIDIPSSASNVPPAGSQPVPTPSGSSGRIFKILVVVLLLGLIAVIAIAAGTFIYFKTRGPEKASLDNTNKTATPAPSQSKDDKDELRDQIANLEKMLNQQKKTNKPANIPLTLPDQPATTTTATVNSPSDGFLALRTYPDSELGDRILKIPHGATITIGACTAARSIPGKRTGRWCRANYNGYTGWIFDAYVTY